MKVGVFFGGKSTEHDVSIASAYAVMKWLARMPGYDVVPVYVTRAGKFVHHPKLADLTAYADVRAILDNMQGVTLSAELSGDEKLRLVETRVGFFAKKTAIEIDVAFPVFHGLGGEDGSMQGFLEMLGVPYVGPGILASAMGINKIAMKDVFRALDLPITRHRSFRLGEEIDEAALVADIGLPLFVKPARLGSTIGITMVRDAAELRDALDVAFHYDTDVVVEAAVANMMELNCSVTERDGEIVASEIENPTSKGGFLTFEQKYTSDEGATMAGSVSTVNIPAPIPAHVAAEVRRIARLIFERFYAGGGAPRIDYLYDTVADKLYVNEINTIPGTLQMHLWAHGGISQTELLRGLIDTAFAEHRRRARNIDFSSNIIEHTIRFVKK